MQQQCMRVVLCMFVRSWSIISLWRRIDCGNMRTSRWVYVFYYYSCIRLAMRARWTQTLCIAAPVPGARMRLQNNLINVTRVGVCACVCVSVSFVVATLSSVRSRVIGICIFGACVCRMDFDILIGYQICRMRTHRIHALANRHSHT